jgi:4-methylaminobutanoate oxidase (formaldehyde-forming)
MDNTDDPYEAGLGFTVRLDTPRDFIGKKACAARKAAGPLKRRLAQVLVMDPEPLLYHGEVIFRNGKPAGYVRSGSYGHSLGGAVGLFMIEADESVDDAYVKNGRWEIDIAGKKYPARVSLTPLYDPEMTKVKQ